METNSYQALKEYISNRLNKLEFPLNQNAIFEEIEKVQKVIATIGSHIFAEILTLQSFDLPAEADWKRLIRELEMHFEVKLEKGILIQGDEQQKRDTSWWTSLGKQQTKGFYWERYRDYLSKDFPPDVVKTIDVDTDIVMNNIENPSVSSFSRYGMVVGHVQSGKTGNYSALICKAADAGYKFIVVIAGGINNLRNQTQERLNESFIGQTKGVQVGAGRGNSSKETTPLSLTTIERDFNKQDADRLAQGLNFDNINVPILLVVKKNSKTLDNVIDWLEKQYKNKVVNHAMLVIDDESDYASINTKDEEDPTAINKRLRKLLSLFQKSAYVAYTATPYANIFIDHKAENDDLGKDLFPKDFIYALDAPSNYFGARKVFIANPDLYLVPIFDFENHIPANHKIDFRVESLPESLLDAIRLFTINIAIRSLRGQRNSHNSMLIHATRFTNIHRLLGGFVEDYLKDLKKEFNAYGRLKDATNQSKIISETKKTFEKHLKANEFPWSKILDEITGLINTLVIREVHQKTAVPLEYRKDIVTNAIVIGGTSLSRGFTLEGLSVSYFLRNTVFYDTLMQMGRWFGYRSGYEDLCRIYMPAERIIDFAEIIRATEDLFEDFKLMAANRKTPNDFGLAVQQNPDSALQITARNKQKNVHEFFFSMRLEGTSKETSYLRSDQNDINYNIDVIKRLIDQMGIPEQVEKSHVWRKIDKQLIIQFLQNFRVFANDRLGLSSRMPIAFIEQYAKDRIYEWDVALYNGTGENFEYHNTSIRKEKRKFTDKGTYFEIQNRQVSSGNAEAVAIVDESLRNLLKKSRRDTRANLARPLLMLHIIEPEFLNEQHKSVHTMKEIAAFGVSFPGNVLSREETVRLKINTVYYQNLLEQIDNDSENDD